MDFILWMGNNNIYPPIIKLKYKIEYSDKIVRAGIYADNGNLSVFTIKEKLEFDREYYDLGLTSDIRFIKKQKSWKEILQ